MISGKRIWEFFSESSRFAVESLSRTSLGSFAVLFWDAAAADAEKVGPQLLSFLASSEDEHGCCDNTCFLLSLTISAFDTVYLPISVLSKCLSLCVCLECFHLPQHITVCQVPDPVMAAEELVPDILAIVAARLKEQVWVKVQRWKVTTFMSTEGSKAHRPGGTGKSNNIKELSYLTLCLINCNWYLTSFIFLVKVEATKFSKQEIRKMYRGFKQESIENKNRRRKPLEVWTGVSQRRSKRRHVQGDLWEVFPLWQWVEKIYLY